MLPRVKPRLIVILFWCLFLQLIPHQSVLWTAVCVLASKLRCLSCCIPSFWFQLLHHCQQHGFGQRFSCCCSALCGHLLFLSQRWLAGTSCEEDAALRPHGSFLVLTLLLMHSFCQTVPVGKHTWDIIHICKIRHILPISSCIPSSLGLCSLLLFIHNPLLFICILVPLLLLYTWFLLMFFLYYFFKCAGGISTP